MPNFCPTCGAELKYPDAEICPSCGVRIKEPITPKSTPEQSEEKSAGIAALCSFFIPGLGQVYNGNLEKGVLILAGTAIGAIFFLIPGIIVWIYGIYEAYTTAEKMSKGGIPFKSTKLSHMILFLILGLFILLIAFILALMVIAFVIAMATFVPTYATVATIATPIATIAPVSSAPQPQPTTCSILGKWIETEYEGKPVTNVYIQIYPNNKIELYLNDQLYNWGTWEITAKDKFRAYWKDGTDTVTISQDCQSQRYVTLGGQYSIFVKETPILR